MHASRGRRQRGILVTRTLQRRSAPVGGARCLF